LVRGEQKRLKQLMKRFNGATEAMKQDKDWDELAEEAEKMQQLLDDLTDEDWMGVDLSTLKRLLDTVQGRAEKKSGFAKECKNFDDAEAALKGPDKDFKEFKAEATDEQEESGNNLLAELQGVLKDKETLTDTEKQTFDQRLQEFKTLIKQIKVGRDEKASKAGDLDKEDGGHSVARHGPDVKPETLKKRLTSGIAPDGVFSPTQTSTKFHSYKEWLATRDAAVKKAEKDNGVKFGSDLTTPPGKNDPLEYHVTMDHGRGVGGGFKGRAGSGKPKQWKGQVVTVYTEVDPLPALTKSYTILEWNSGKGRWVVVRHHPCE
jgi:hypothetical protein